MRPSVVTASALVAAIAACPSCGDGPRRISLEPVPLADPSCGAPAGTTGLLVTALGDGPDDPESIEPGAPVAIDDFPAGTRQLMVEVLGDAGETVALGRTAPFALDELADGTVLRVLMAPPDGACDVGALSEPRRGPLVAAAGDDAVVIGGGPGQPLGTADWYDASAGTFAAIELPPAFTGALGTAGASLVTMTDGRVVLIGGDRPVYGVLQPSARGFVDDGAIFELRGHHAAVALDHARIAVAGGCGALDRDTGACVPGTERRETFTVDIDTGEVLYGPTLARDRIGGALILERDPDGGPVRLVAVGGVDGTGDPVLDAERYDPAGAPADGPLATIADAGGIAGRLASGSTVVAFPEATVTATVIVPGVDVARVVVDMGGLRATGRSVPLEDGSALWTDAVGGAAVRYLPLATRFTAIDAYDATWAGQGAARLTDGTVLLAGGAIDGDATARATVLRPAGDGPFTGALTITPGAGGELPIVPFDPALVTATPELRVRAESDALASWIVVGGVRPDEVELEAIVRVEGGAAVLLGFVDPGRFDELELVPGEPARLLRRDGTGAAPVAVCRGEDVDGADLNAPVVTIDVVARGGVIRASIAGREVLSCEVDGLREGHVGLAPVGDGAAITLLTMALAR